MKLSILGTPLLIFLWIFFWSCIGSWSANWLNMPLLGALKNNNISWINCVVYVVPTIDFHRVSMLAGVSGSGRSTAGTTELING